MSRILIIEDDMDLQEGLTYFLEKEGYEILTAGTKKAGMEILRKGLCDLVLLGLQPAGRERLRHLCPRHRSTGTSRS